MLFSSAKKKCGKSVLRVLRVFVLAAVLFVSMFHNSYSVHAIAHPEVKTLADLVILKNWQDQEGNEAEAPVESVTVMLTENDLIGELEVTLNSGNNWKLDLYAEELSAEGYEGSFEEYMVSTFNDYIDMCLDEYGDTVEEAQRYTQSFTADEYKTQLQEATASMTVLEDSKEEGIVTYTCTAEDGSEYEQEYEYTYEIRYEFTEYEYRGVHYFIPCVVIELDNTLIPHEADVPVIDKTWTGTEAEETSVICDDETIVLNQDNGFVHYGLAENDYTSAEEYILNAETVETEALCDVTVKEAGEEDGVVEINGIKYNVTYSADTETVNETVNGIPYTVTYYYYHVNNEEIVQPVPEETAEPETTPEPETPSETETPGTGVNTADTFSGGIFGGMMLAGAGLAAATWFALKKND